MVVATREPAPRLKRARTDETLLEIVSRDGVAKDDIFLRTENGYENDEIPYKTVLDEAYPRVAKKGRYPVIWLSHVFPDDYKVPLIVSHMRTWANAEPVSSMVQFLSRYALVDHQFESDHPLAEEFRAAEVTSKKEGKRWPVYGLWPEGTHDGLVVTRATWFLSRISASTRNGNHGY